jgi:ATP-binding cassette subfamily E protein 1
MPRNGEVLGLVGSNGTGKSTALKILSGKLKPNLGRFADPPDWNEILVNFRGSELQNYFTRILEDHLKAAIKPQYVDYIPKAVRGIVGDVLRSKDQKGILEDMIRLLDMQNLLDKEIAVLSGGELQRFAICVVAIQNNDVYMFDEPSSYLDVQQRMKAATAIRSLLHGENYVICVEHDLAILDYLSDFICCLWGEPSVYGVVTMPFSVREGINIFLAGFIPTENLRFRDDALVFNVSDSPDEFAMLSKTAHYNYEAMRKTFNGFRLTIEPGNFSNSEIIVMLGQNGTGKTTFIKMLAGKLAPDEGSKVPELSVSYKPQVISATFQGTVRGLFHQKIRESLNNAQFQSDVMKPLKIEDVIDNEVKQLSGGELQRVAIALTLGKTADIYLIDEPSAYLDSEQRIVAARVMKRFILNNKKTAFIVEHDFIMATYLADKVVVYEGTPSIDCTAKSPEGLISGMNRFLSMLNITFRRDPENFRPRINKLDSVKDREQKSAGRFFTVDE